MPSVFSNGALGIFLNMLDLGDKKLCDLCFGEVEGDVCDKCSGVSNTDRYPTSLREGTVLAGKYAVGRVLGKGGFGITYLCYDLENQKKVAIKEYLPDTLAFRNTGESVVKILNSDNAQSFTEGARKFYEEAQTVSKFKTKDNIIHVNEFFYENKTAYFAMDAEDCKYYRADVYDVTEDYILAIGNPIWNEP